MRRRSRAPLLDSLDEEGEDDAAELPAVFDLLCVRSGDGDSRRRPRLGHGHGGGGKRGEGRDISMWRERARVRGVLIHLAVNNGEQGWHGGERARLEQLGARDRYRRR